MNKRFTKLAVATAVALIATAGAARADDDIAPSAMQQMADAAAAKAKFTPEQIKMGTALAFGVLAANNDPSVASFSNAIQPLGTQNDVTASPKPAGGNTSGMVAIDIYAPVSDSLNAAIVASNGKVLFASKTFNVTTASVPVGSLTSIASRSDVTKMRLSAGARTNVGSLTSQGYVAHGANKVVNNLGITGAGVKVGVLSDSATAARVAALKSSGDLKASATVLPGQEGAGEDEGTAMMEIVQDMAPGADIIFATAFTSEASFAQNILDLAAAGCKVIVDDVTYFDEGVFQDGIVAQAVNTVTAQGVTYFSSAANSGSLTKNTSGTWEGDFKAAGPATGLLAGAGVLHNFAPTGTQTFNRLTGTTNFVIINWSDPLGGSANDYDLYVLNAAGTQVLAIGGDTQNGTQDPQEFAYINNGNSNFPANARIVIAKYSGADRALHLDTERGVVSIGTSGATFGHNAGANTNSMAATYWNSAKTGARPFTGPANTNETFSSDGPRKIFYNPNGTPITPGNLLFATNGGTTLQKPDFAAADGVQTNTPGFLPFFGTSAAAPHAAGIAALILQAKPNYTPAQVKAAMRATALDSMTAGVDRDSGYGIIDAYAAVQYAIAH